MSDFVDVVAAIKSIQTGINSLDSTLYHLDKKVDEVIRKVTALEARSASKLCVLCCLDSNLDGHSSQRCTIFPDLRSKVLRLAELRKCSRCLLAEHEDACTAVCPKCSGPHALLLCDKPTFNGYQSGPKRSRQY